MEMSPETTQKSTPRKQSSLEQLQAQIESVIAPLGYEVVALEMSAGGGRTLRLYIDFLENALLSEQSELKRVSLDDCVVVNRALDELLETTPLIEGAYNLEVSSPGVERPLRKEKDFRRFAGQKVRISTFRSLTADELANPAYWDKNKRQKNFLGILCGLSENSQDIQLSIDGQTIKIPRDLVAKSHLEFVEPTPKKGSSSHEPH